MNLFETFWVREINFHISDHIVGPFALKIAVYMHNSGHQKCIQLERGNDCKYTQKT